MGFYPSRQSLSNCIYVTTTNNYVDLLTVPDKEYYQNVKCYLYLRGAVITAGAVAVFVKKAGGTHYVELEVKYLPLSSVDTPKSYILLENREILIEPGDIFAFYMNNLGTTVNLEVQASRIPKPQE